MERTFIFLVILLAFSGCNSGEEQSEAKSTTEKVESGSGDAFFQDEDALVIRWVGAEQSSRSFFMYEGEKALTVMVGNTIISGSLKERSQKSCLSQVQNTIKSLPPEKKLKGIDDAASACLLQTFAKGETTRRSYFYKVGDSIPLRILYDWCQKAVAQPDSFFEEARISAAITPVGYSWELEGQTDKAYNLDPTTMIFIEAWLGQASPAQEDFEALAWLETGTPGLRRVETDGRFWKLFQDDGSQHSLDLGFDAFARLKKFGIGAPVVFSPVEKP